MLNKETGETYQDFFLQQALSDAQYYQTMYNEALKAGYSVDNVKASVDAQISNMKSTATAYGYDFNSFLKAMYGRYATPELVEKVLTPSFGS